MARAEGGIELREVLADEAFEREEEVAILETSELSVAHV